MEESTLSRRERKKQQNQQQILEAALRLFEAQGVEATTIDQIAEAADVSRGTFFNYFPTKETLLSEIAALELQTLEARVTVQTGTSAVQRIHDLIRDLVTDTLASLEITRFILLDAMQHPATSTSPNVRLDGILRNLVVQAQAQSEIRPDLDPATVTGAMVGIYLNAFFRLIAAEDDVTRASALEVAATIRLLFDGIAGPNYSTDF